MSVTMYGYSKCGTCRNALKKLTSLGIETDFVPIFEQPPGEQRLEELVRYSGLPLSKFFNVSGEAYRELNLKEQLPHMSDQEKIALLASNGRLLKRPLVVDGERVVVGFKEDDYERLWGTGTS